MAWAVGPSSVSETSIRASQPAGVIALQPRQRAAGELHGGPAGRQIDHAHVAPEHAAPEAGAERLGAGLLGGEALGVGLAAVGAPLGLGAFGRRVDAVEEALAMALDDACDAADVDDVGADADDHDVLRSRCACGRGPWPRA